MLLVTSRVWNLNSSAHTELRNLELIPYSVAFYQFNAPNYHCVRLNSFGQTIRMKKL